MAFTFIPNGDLLPGKPLSTDLMTQFRDNDEFLFNTATRTLERKIVSGSAITTFDFATVLDGNTDRVYQLLLRVKNAIAGTRNLFFRLNGSTFGASLVLMPSSGLVQIRALIHVKDDILGLFRFDVMNNSGAFTNSFISRAASAGNVTSLGFSTGDAAIDVGSEFNLILPGKGP